MPYIAPSLRDQLRPKSQDHAHVPGELNFQMTCLVIEYLKHQGTRYQTFNDVMGVLACMQAEIYRRLITSYEDLKISESGDVFV